MTDKSTLSVEEYLGKKETDYNTRIHRALFDN